MNADPLNSPVYYTVPLCLPSNFWVASKQLHVGDTEPVSASERAGSVRVLCHLAQEHNKTTLISTLKVLL